jgi:hypothetical protein
MKNLKLLTILCLIFGVLITYNSIVKKKLKRDIVLNNIEALATTENMEDLDDCYEYGTTKCPAGGYTRIIITNSRNHNIIKKYFHQ